MNSLRTRCGFVCISIQMFHIPFQRQFYTLFRYEENSIFKNFVKSHLFSRVVTYMYNYNSINFHDSLYKEATMIVVNGGGSIIILVYITQVHVQIRKLCVHVHHLGTWSNARRNKLLQWNPSIPDTVGTNIHISVPITGASSFQG